MSATHSGSGSERILVRGVNWLGDAVMTTPALQRLREAHPKAHIALLTPSKLEGLWKLHTDIDQVVTFEPGESVWSVGRRLRRLEFTTALVLPNSPRSALEVFLARIPRRVGHPRPWRDWLLTERVPPRAAETPMRKRTPSEIRRLIASPEASRPPAMLAPETHHVHLYLNLAAALGAAREVAAPRIFVAETEVEGILRRFKFPSRGPGRNPALLGIHAGAEYGPAKRWPRERFIAAAVKAREKTGCHCWVFGGPSEVNFARELAAEIGRAGSPGTVRSLAGETSLRELCVALKACHVLLTNDSGPMHVAAAAGTLVVAPFGSTSPELTGPGLPGLARQFRHQVFSARAVCSPCFLRECPIDFRCMTNIPASDVAAALIRALEGREINPG
jgi:lipopolysaccharide heptosyltransferase II